jgi:hypothetical protein
VNDPHTPVRITVEALGRRSEFTQDEARERAQQLVAAGDPRATNPVIRSLAAGEPWKDAIGYSGEPGRGSDYRDRARALFGPSNTDVGEAAVAITDPIVPPLPVAPAPRADVWDPPGGIPAHWWAGPGAAADFSTVEPVVGPFDTFSAPGTAAVDHSAFDTFDLGAGDFSDYDVGAPDLFAPDLFAPDLFAPDLFAPDLFAFDLGATDFATSDLGGHDFGTLGTAGYDFSSDAGFEISGAWAF